jgi:hypothetical protein
VSTRRGRGRVTVALVKDLILFATGLLLIFDQAFLVRPQDFNPYLLAMGGVLAGVPPSLQILAGRTDGRRSPGEPLRSPPSPRSSPRGPGVSR